MGNVAEAGFAFHAIKAGLRVLTPMTEHGAYDLALDLEGRILRLQIKSASLSKTRDFIVVRIRRSRHTPLNGYVTSTYSADEVDAFGIYCPELDRCYLIPIDATNAQCQIHLRLTPPRNGQRAALHFAADYEFPGAVAQLGRAPRWQRGGRGFESHQLHSQEATDAHAPGADTRVGANAFRDHFGEYMERVNRGESILVTRHRKPFVRLLPASG